ncbi:MAG: DUF2971 domain-containing protein, partial [Candidatus Electrothrix sp. AR4]|nr:DUF2971 domain-containing protein [Candidatus Electrothrix sp. AR4]
MLLYKYRAFGENLIKELCNKEVYYADPKKFNDPLECSPKLINDGANLESLEKLYCEIANQSDEKNINKTIDELRNDAIEYVYTWTQVEDKELDKEEEISFIRKYHKSRLQDKIKEYLDSIMKKRGILSLSSTWKSPLMWSHYSDQHRGICIEYEFSDTK